MQDIRYLLSIEELLESDCKDELGKRCSHWLDAERQNRLERLQNRKKQAECIGAGLLLQLAVMKLPGKEAGAIVEQERLEELIQMNVSDVLMVLEQSGQKPYALEYTYGEWGKPYWKNLSYYFNLSHSGKYIFCVVSTQEVGVDIQWEKPLKDDRLAQKYFTEEEKESLARLKSLEEKQKEFYRLWARKEAYGKLTGRGVVAAMQEELEIQKQEAVLQKVRIDEFAMEQYHLAVCKWK